METYFLFSLTLSFSVIHLSIPQQVIPGSDPRLIQMNDPRLFQARLGANFGQGPFLGRGFAGTAGAGVVNPALLGRQFPLTGLGATGLGATGLGATGLGRRTLGSTTFNNPLLSLGVDPRFNTFNTRNSNNAFTAPILATDPRLRAAVGATRINGVDPRLQGFSSRLGGANAGLGPLPPQALTASIGLNGLNGVSLCGNIQCPASRPVCIVLEGEATCIPSDCPTTSCPPGCTLKAFDRSRESTQCPRCECNRQVINGRTNSQSIIGRRIDVALATQCQVTTCPVGSQCYLVSGQELCVPTGCKIPVCRPECRLFTGNGITCPTCDCSFNDQFCRILCPADTRCEIVNRQEICVPTGCPRPNCPTNCIIRPGGLGFDCPSCSCRLTGNGRACGLERCDSREDCEYIAGQGVCIHIDCARPQCPSDCPVEIVRDARQCPLCRCSYANPCRGFTCPLGQACQPQCLTRPCVPQPTCVPEFLANPLLNTTSIQVDGINIVPTDDVTVG